ncbi:hypothetical protein CHX27_07225 [Flavobacterium aurantiibacter]|uniref:Uncharacterized protein n=1 Tax=Flavobacterium aurantiibacter TaxID=2023067 RepID=A0A255ZTA3_9FLAO|nr:hypothetical protein CHX27_07225 [Flavobacterium aurantiibacter]
MGGISRFTLQGASPKNVSTARCWGFRWSPLQLGFQALFGATAFRFNRGRGKRYRRVVLSFAKNF